MMNQKGGGEMFLTKNKIRDLDGVIGYFDSEKVQNICYDLRTECFISGNEMKSISLQPMSSVMVKTKETLQLPANLLAMISLRNSRIRQGLTLDAPIYQPGHHTAIYFRITNLSDKVIDLTTEDEVASALFYRLDEETYTYDGTFQDEEEYKGFASYDLSLSRELSEVKQTADSVKTMEKDIYGNVLQIMAIFVGIFSLINVNLSAALAHADTKTILVLNLATIGSVAVLISLAGKQRRLIGWIIGALAFAVAIFVQLVM